MIGSRIKLARELCGWTQAELADKIGTTQSGVASLEGNLYRPSREYLATLVKATGFSENFFTSPLAEEFPSGALLYRSRASVTKTERQQAHAFTSIAYELAVFLGRGLKQIPSNIPRLRETPDRAAQITRTALEIAPLNPIANLMHLVERAGVLVLSIPKEIEGLDGFATWVGTPFQRPVVALLGGKTGYRTNFTIAEEIGHLVMHSPLTVTVTEADAQAREFAQELLLPRDAILDEFPQPVTLAGLVKLKPRWNVSLQMLIRRAHDLGAVTANQYRYLNQQVRMKGWAKSEPGDDSIPQPSPRVLRKMAELRFGNPIDSQQISRETGIPVSLISQVLGIPEPIKKGRVIQFRKS
jgi:Zn-dependent peptidase ImmA (M78 family)/DNA-binding XRE family transcriptional regulator